MCNLRVISIMSGVNVRMKIVFLRLRYDVSKNEEHNKWRMAGIGGKGRAPRIRSACSVQRRAHEKGEEERERRERRERGRGA